MPRLRLAAIRVEQVVVGPVVDGEDGADEGGECDVAVPNQNLSMVRLGLFFEIARAGSDIAVVKGTAGHHQQRNIIPLHTYTEPDRKRGVERLYTIPVERKTAVHCMNPSLRRHILPALLPALFLVLVQGTAHPAVAGPGAHGSGNLRSLPHLAYHGGTPAKGLAVIEPQVIAALIAFEQDPRGRKGSGPSWKGTRTRRDARGSRPGAWPARAPSGTSVSLIDVLETYRL